MQGIVSVGEDGRPDGGTEPPGRGPAPPATSGGTPAGGVRYDVGVVKRLPYPLRNVLRRWRGTIGMMLGVGIALGVAMTMLAVSQASLDLYTLDYKRSAADLYVVTEGGILIPVWPSDQPGTIERARGSLARMRNWPEVAAAVGVMLWQMERQTEGPRRPDAPRELVATVGVDGDPTQIAGMAVLTQGRWLRRPTEIVVGPRLSRDRGMPLGATVRLAGQDFTVVGIGKLRGLGAAVSADGVAFMESGAFVQRAGLGDVVSVVMVDSREPGITRRRLDELDEYDVYAPADLIRKAAELNQAAVGIYWVLIGLTMAIAGLFVSNMLARSVAERRLEFATLRAIGIPRRTVLLTVAAEAVLISAVAGVLGVGLSLLLGFLLNATVAAAYSIESLYAADAGLYAVVFLMASLLGLVSGLLPARQATRVDPVEVLREA